LALEGTPRGFHLFLTATTSTLALQGSECAPLSHARAIGLVPACGAGFLTIRARELAAWPVCAWWWISCVFVLCSRAQKRPHSTKPAPPSCRPSDRLRRCLWQLSKRYCASAFSSVLVSLFLFGFRLKPQSSVFERASVGLSCLHFQATRTVVMRFWRCADVLGADARAWGFSSAHGSCSGPES